ncbi:MAG: glycosyltransferase family 4 protein [Candidatus Bathyarchaeota archaeon]|nr:glycosyltransferase family 4 protein [Candidatus Bathyarchaeota archaeon]
MDRFRLAVFNTQPPHLYFGGVERRIIETTKRLQAHADIAIYSATKAGFQTPTKINGIEIIPCKSTDRLYPLDNWGFNRSLTHTPSAYNFDIYEAHTISGYGFPDALKKRGLKKPFIHVIHGPLADEYEQAKASGSQSARDRLANLNMKRQANMEEAMAKKTDLIVAVSQYSKGKMLQYYNLEASKIRVVPNGVDIEKYVPKPASEEKKRRFGLGAEPCVLFVGSLIPRKGLPYLVEAAKIVIKAQPTVKFVLVGDGPLKPQLTATLQAAGLLGNFMFLRNLTEDDLVGIYSCADVFVLPSVQEGQGIVLLEAQASGVPVVAFGVGGVNEAVRNGETGLLIERGDTNALADALQKILSDKTLRDKMGIAGRRFVTENYSWDLCAKRMLALYREVLG